MFPKLILQPRRVNKTTGDKEKQVRSLSSFLCAVFVSKRNQVAGKPMVAMVWVMDGKIVRSILMEKDITENLNAISDQK